MRIQAAAIGTVLALASAGIVAGRAASQTQPRPGPGTGVIPIEGTVTVTNIPSVAVSNTPTVLATQSGDWKVAVTTMPAVRLAAPAFLKEGRRYRVTWPSGQQEELTVQRIADGWLLGDRVEGGARGVRWINPAMVAAVETR
jgi:hypothetical protein